MKPTTMHSFTSSDSSTPSTSRSSPTPTLSASSSASAIEERLEPPDVFCNLGSLIVEGRVPRGEARGFGEGPHVPWTGNKGAGHRHECSLEDYMCKKDENFRKHMVLLWQNNVPVSIEVLLCPDCRVNPRSPAVEFSAIPETGSILLEQWKVAIHNTRSSDKHLLTSRSLYQAVRSYLHFSQLSAWFTSSRGEKPRNVLYRVTIPGETFASKFSKQPEEHYFPSADAGRGTTVHVSVRSLPRTDEIPQVLCVHNAANVEAATDDAEENKLAMAGALAWKESNSFENDLRKALIKSKLQPPAQSECWNAGSSLFRSDSMDSMLGDSLLDPPQCLKKLPPKRYQSPSRCGSPSLEAPEYLFGRQRENSDSVRSSSERCARADLLRRRDLTMFHGLHPSRFQTVPSKLSLPPKGEKTNSDQRPLDDRMQVRCRISGKHICSLEEDEAGSEECGLASNTQTSSADKSPEDWTHEYSLQRRSPDESGIGGEMEDDILSQKTPSSSRRSSLKEDDRALLKKRSSLHDIFDDGLGSSKSFVNPNLVTQVYRAETATKVNPFPEVDKGQLLLSSIIRTSERNKRLEEEEERKKREEHKTEEESNRLDEINELGKRMMKTVIDPRKRSYSENVLKNDDSFLEPLDLSFDNEGSIWSDDIQSPNDDDDEYDSGSTTPCNNFVPSSVEKDTFRKSFDSAASMVFHRKTGLPLTSSPAPMVRKGKEKFDFDSTITSPQDIKKALFHTENQKLNPPKRHMSSVTPTKTRKSRRSHTLSTSAPATVPSSNLLGSFEESVLNGRLDPVSTVEGFTAEIGASGAFHPKHLTVPVTVFFYTLCDNNNVSSPYLGHINLVKKGYRVPDKGTIQVTLFNPLGTVVKMFVVMYDLCDMPPNSQTFLRQRTLYMPSDMSNVDEVHGQRWLRYLVHLRFSSSKSGRIYLHTDIRMIIFRKSDLDTATDHAPGKGFELRSFTCGPKNPKFSPRK